MTRAVTIRVVMEVPDGATHYLKDHLYPSRMEWWKKERLPDRTVVWSVRGPRDGWYGVPPDSVNVSRLEEV